MWLNVYFCEQNLEFMKRLFLLVLSMSVSILSWSQRPHGEFNRFVDRFYGGGTLGLNFGNRFTLIDIEPMGGFWIFPQWTLGATARYMFRRERFNLEQGTSKPITHHIWGLSGFTQVLPIPDLYDAFGINIRGGPVLHCEYENLYISRKLVDLEATSGWQWVNICFVGVGWRQRLGDRLAVNVLVLWDVYRSSYSPYLDNPLIRFNIVF